MSNNISYYDILGIPKQASQDEIKQAYLVLAKKYHPDQNPQNKPLAMRRFQRILEAYETLRSREKRAYYNKELRQAETEANDNTNTNTPSLFLNLGKWLSHKTKTNKT